MIQIGWIDYSKEHRDRVMSVLDMLATPGAMDELGISVIRDAFAERLFPGLSTLLTRAKYYLIVPWIMRDLERENLPAAQFARRLHQDEIAMIRVLCDSGEKRDVIGERARETLKRKPSDVYWNGLRTFGIFRDSHMSLANYLAAAHKVNRANQDRKASLLRDESDARDDQDAFAAETIRPFWDALEPPDEWRTQMRFHLSPDEGRFLRDKILSSPYSKNSLLAHIIAQHAADACDCATFGDLSELDMPADIRADYDLARDFAQLIYGAHIRYNIAFFESIEQQDKADSIRLEWDGWVSEIDGFDFDGWDTHQMLRRLHIDRNRHAVGFVAKWIDHYAKRLHAVSDSELDDFVTRREVQIKGRDRAKIGSWQEFNGDWIGITRLQYRWPNARKIIADIEAGLREENATTGS